MNYSTKALLDEVIKNQHRYTQVDAVALISSFAEIAQRLKSDPQFDIDELDGDELQAAIDVIVLAGRSPEERERYEQVKKLAQGLPLQN